MKIIGAGFGRTGTMSRRAALEQLEFAPCYHMLEVYKRPGHIKIWQAAADGKPVDWNHFLGKYQAGLDYPLVAFLPELVKTFPDAKVILTVRDSERWYESTRETIYHENTETNLLVKYVPWFKQMNTMVQSTTWDRLFEGTFEDRRHAIKVFKEHIDKVKRLVPSERLLIFEVSQGWGPLCTFLGKSVPKPPFPHINDRKTVRRMSLLAQIVGGAGFVAGILLLLYLFGR